jgi:hypothetical protein
VIVKYLRNMGVSSIGLWGRSMGGASALRFRGPVVARVIDSTFSDLETVAIEVVQKKIMIPAFSGPELYQGLGERESEKRYFRPAYRGICEDVETTGDVCGF